MHVTIRDVSVFIYTVGVVLSGMWLVEGRPEITPRLAILGAAVAAVWTTYFRWKITPQFVPDEDDDEGLDEENADVRGERPTPDE